MCLAFSLRISVSHFSFSSIYLYFPCIIGESSQVYHLHYRFSFLHKYSVVFASNSDFSFSILLIFNKISLLISYAFYLTYTYLSTSITFLKMCVCVASYYFTYCCIKRGISMPGIWKVIGKDRIWLFCHWAPLGAVTVLVLDLKLEKLFMYKVLAILFGSCLCMLIISLLN